MSLSGVDPELQRRLTEFRRQLQANRIAVTITSTYRDPAKQRRLYDAWIKRGRTGLPVARPGLSTHEYGYAVDLVPAQRDPLTMEIVVAIAAGAGLVWAGKRDPVHFDLFGFERWNRILRESGLL